MEKKDNRIFSVLIAIAIGIWLNLFVQLFPIGPVQATDGVLDINIVEVGGEPLPIFETGRILDNYHEAIPIILYMETDNPLAYIHWNQPEE